PASAIVVNRTIGLGLDSLASKDDVDRIVASYRDAGISRYFVHVHPNAKPTGLGAWLRAAGLEKARGWQKFVRGAAPPPEVRTDLAIRRVGPEHGEDFARIVCDAFDLGASAIPWLAEIPGQDDFHVFMSFDGDTPAGTGGLFVRNGFAWLDFGA